MWLFLSKLDQTDVRAANKRQFPFSTITSDKELYFRIYGSGLKTTAPKFAATIAAAATFVASQSANGITESVGVVTFGLDATVYATKDPETDKTTSLMTWKFGAATWGGYCC